MTTNIVKQAFNRQEAATYLGMAENTLRKLLDTGEISYATVGRRLVIPKISLDNYLERIATGTKGR